MKISGVVVSFPAVFRKPILVLQVVLVSFCYNVTSATGCTTGTIIVKKHTDPGGSTQSFQFNPSWSYYNFSLRDGEKKEKDLDSGCYTVKEVSIPEDWTLTAITIDDPTNNSSFNLETGTASIHLDNQETVTVTFTNTLQRGTIIIEKQTNPDGSTQSFQFDPSWSHYNFSLRDGENKEKDLDSGCYTVKEVSIPAGWTLTAMTINDPTNNSSFNLETGTASIHLDNQETVTVTFTNTLRRGCIVVQKQTDPDGATESFQFHPSYGANFALTDGQSNNSGPLLPGTYSVSETGIPAGWSLTSAICSDGSDPGHIELGCGETVTVTFTNTLRRGCIIVQKQTDPDGATESFQFHPSYGANFALTDGQSNNSGPLPPGTYSVSETGIPTGWSLTSAICSDGSDPGHIELGCGETVTVTFTNTLRRGCIIVQKQTDPDGATESFQFHPSYGANFALTDGQSNNSGPLLPGTYSVSETGIPAGWSLTSVICSDGSDPGHIELGCGETVTVTFTNTLKRGTIIIEKQTDPDGHTQSFEFQGNEASGFIQDGQQIKVEGLLPGQYTSQEIVPVGWELTSITLDDGASASLSFGDKASGIVTFNLDPGETVKAVFTNKKLPPGTIIIEKDARYDCLNLCEELPTFTFTGDVGGSIKNGEQIVITDLLPGEYTTTETPFGDWFIAGITVDDDNSSYSISGDGKIGTVTFRIEAGETVKAVFRNTKPSVMVSLTSGPGGRVTSPGEGDFTYCLGSRICLTAEATDPLFDFVGWRGSLFANVNPDCNNTPITGQTSTCGEIPIGVLSCAGTECLKLELIQDHHIQAVFVSRLDTLYVDDDGPNDPAPCDNTDSDPNENGTPEHPFDMIQEAIDVAKMGATVLVREGYYRENIDFLGKCITVTSFMADGSESPLGYPIIAGTAERGGGHVVTFKDINDPNAGLSGFVVTGGYGTYAGGIMCSNSSPTIQNCLIVGNRADTTQGRGGAVYSVKSKPVFVNCTMCGNYGGSNGAGLYSINSKVVILNSVLYNNLPEEIVSDGNSVLVMTYTDMAGGYPGEGNIDVDPQFELPGYWGHPLNPGLIVHPGDYGAVWIKGDYHLRSESPCIDTGDPSMAVGAEPEPNGGRINVGAYGGTVQATPTQVVAP